MKRIESPTFYYATESKFDEAASVDQASTIYYTLCQKLKKRLVRIHYSYDESITVCKLGHLFPNYNVLIGNFDNFSSNLIVSDD